MVWRSRGSPESCLPTFFRPECIFHRTIPYCPQFLYLFFNSKDECCPMNLFFSLFLFGGEIRGRAMERPHASSLAPNQTHTHHHHLGTEEGTASSNITCTVHLDSTLWNLNKLPRSTTHPGRVRCKRRPTTMKTNRTKNRSWAHEPHPCIHITTKKTPPSKITNSHTSSPILCTSPSKMRGREGEKRRGERARPNAGLPFLQG